MNKTNMNKNKILYVILAILIAILALCIFGEVSHLVNKSEEPKITNLVDSLNHVIKQKDSILFEVTEERDFYKLEAEEISNEMRYEIDANILP
jgi:flagellar basal body-associated protein FliL